MHRGRSLLRSTAFRLSLAFTVLFLLAFALSGAAVYNIMGRTLARGLDEAVDRTFQVIASTSAEEDTDDLRNAVESYARVSDGVTQFFALTRKDGKLIAGNFAPPSLPQGLFTVSAGELGLDRHGSYRVRSGPAGADILTVGMSDTEAERLKSVLLGGLWWASLVAAGLAISFGTVLALRLQKRLDAIAKTLDDVSEGDLAARIPLLGRGDDIDAVADRINAALKRLSALVEGMRQVSSDIAHDLKTPLNRLQMLLEQAADRAERGLDVSTALSEAKGESLQINTTFEALLRIAQIEAGARRSRFVATDLAGIVAAMAEIYADVAEDDGKSLALASDHAGPAWISGDRDLLNQLFSNLVENALRHCPSGTRIQLGTRQAGAEVVAVVSDNGPGIPHEERENVFRRLYRLDKSRTTPGTGLGLSLVAAIAELHDATIRLDDNAPGLKVVLTFPATNGAQAPAWSPPPRP